MAEYASSAVGTAGLTTGIIGTTLGAASSGLLGNLFGGIGSAQQNYVNRETFDLSLQLSASQRDNAILTAGLNTEKQIVETYKALNDKMMNIRDELSASIAAVNKKADDGFAAQAVINCGMSSSIGILQTQVEQLMSMTKLGILNSSLWPAA